MAGPFSFPPLVRGGRRSVEDFGVYVLPQEFIPRNATFVDQSREVVVPAGIPGVPGTIIAYEMLTPPNRRGVVRRLAVDAADPAALPSITFDILLSGAPVPNYRGVQAPIGSIGEPDMVYVEADREHRLQVQINNSDTLNPWDVDMRIVAWFWAIQVEAGR